MNPVDLAVTGVENSGVFDFGIDGYRPAWRQRLWHVDLLGWPSPEGEVAIGFALSRTYLTVFNVGDRNGLAFGSPASHYEQHVLARVSPTGSRAFAKTHWRATATTATLRQAVREN